MTNSKNSVKQLQIKEFVEKAREGDIDIVKNTRNAVDKCRKLNERYSFFNTISEKVAVDQAQQAEKKREGKLLGVLISVKDCICVKGMESRAGSRILEGYTPVFDATVIRKLKDEGAVMIGKTAQDEFGFGSFSVNVGVGMKVPKNPFDDTRACGGSSGGSAGITQIADFPHISIGESTGGSIVAPASFCGVFGLCPTYGRVSRYGLMDYANSLDKIGPIAKSIYDIALCLEIIAGHDENESTSVDAPVPRYTSSVGKGVKGMRIGVIKETFGKGVDPKVSEKVMSAIERLKDEGAEVDEVTLPLTSKYGVSAYYLISLSETSTNLAKYCGMRYGKTEENISQPFNDYFSDVRSKWFGAEAKRRIILGTFARMSGFREAYYIKALKVRTKIIDEYKKLFSKYDVLISPTMPILPPRFDEIEELTPWENYMMDIMTVGPNVAGLPHLNIPVGMADDLPVGMLAIADHLEEEKLIALGGVFS